MPRLHFPDQALVLRMVEAAVKGGKPLMLAHDHGVYLCHDDIKEHDGTCVCVYAKGCDPRQTERWFETANALVGGDDFGISIPLGGQESLLTDLKRGHRMAINFGRRAVTIVTQAPPSNPSQPTPAARGRGAESPHNARNRSIDMTAATKTKTTKAATKKGATKATSSSEKLRKAAIAEIGDRIAKLDGAPTTNGKAKPAKASAAKEPKPSKASKEKKSPVAKRTSALDAAAEVLKSAKEPMTASAMITAMAERGLWTSPGGKTPHATLYAALIREIKAKGKDARFTKTDRGLFTANGKAS